MCALAHWIEAQGIATALIGLIPQHVERMRPPRALLVPFELGRPLGHPGDVTLQHRVLDAALGLVARSDTPVTEWLDVSSPDSQSTGDATDGPWACPVYFPQPASEAPASVTAILRELDLLEPWHDRAVLARGGSAVGASGVDIREAARFLAGFLDLPWPAELPGHTLADGFKLAAEDLKLWYLEAAAAQPGDSSRAISDWFWEGTQAGALLQRLADSLIRTPDARLNLFARFTLIPESRRRDA